METLELFMRWTANKIEIIEAVLVETGVVEEGTLESIYNDYTNGVGKDSGITGKSARLVKLR